MSRYVVLIRASIILSEPFDSDVPDRAIDYYAISVSNNPAIALASLQDYCPLPCELIHKIESGPRTEYLERTLHIKFNSKRLRPGSFWFTLAPEDVALIQSLNESNFFTQAGFVNKSLAPAPPPIIATEDLPDVIAQQIAKCQQLTAK